MKNGDVAGLAAYNRGFSYVAVKRVDGVEHARRRQPGRSRSRSTSTRRRWRTSCRARRCRWADATEVHVKADLDFASPAGQLWTTFYYSLDGLQWTQLGSRVGPQTLDGSLAHFMGHRVGLFNYATQETGGHVDFDDYLLSDTLTAQDRPLDTERPRRGHRARGNARRAPTTRPTPGPRCRPRSPRRVGTGRSSSAPRTRSTHRSGRSATSWPGSACSRPTSDPPARSAAPCRRRSRSRSARRRASARSRRAWPRTTRRRRPRT